MSPREFWTWFGAHEGLALRWPPASDFVEEIGERLREIHSGLAFELTRADPPVLAISASGDGALFDLVREIVACAPSLQFVRVVAFRQRGPVAGFALRYADGRTLSCDDIWFRLTAGEKAVGLFVFVRNFPAENPGHTQENVYLLLDNALGEEDVVTRIQWIEWAPLPADPSLVGLHPLLALPDLLDQALGRPPQP